MKAYDFEQYSEQWWLARLGKASASNAKKLVTSTGGVSKQMSDYAIELACNLHAGKDLNEWEGNQHTERGHELEDLGRADYQMLAQVEVSEVGMFTDDMGRWVASPDGVIGDDGLLEIKCLSPKVHAKALMYYRKNKKPPTDYIPQLQMQMFIAEKEWCDLYLYSPDLPCLVIHQPRDNAFIKTLELQLKAVDAERNIVLKMLKEF